MIYTFIKRIAGISAVLCMSFFTSFGQLVVTDTGDCNAHVLHATITGTLPTGTGITGDDVYSGVFPIGFTFNFYGTNYTQLVIGSNGVINFDLTLAGAYCPWPITAALLGNPSMRNAICAPWVDILISSGGTITRSLSGTAPNRKYSVTWCATRQYSCTTMWVTTQIVLYETSNLVEVHTANKTICAWNGGHAITGVQNMAGTAATVAPARDWTPNWTVPPVEGWRFTPSGATYTVASIPYAPLPYATSGTYWYNATTGAYLGSGPYLPVNPPVNTTYMVAALGCNDTTKAFITVGPCISVCEGDTLTLNRPGDSTAATYKWYGPAPSTTIFSTTQKTIIFPTTTAHNGTFSVVRTVGGISDTQTVTINVRHKPNVTASSNAPLCIGTTSSLSLTATCDSPAVTYSWTAWPPPFTSSVQNPVKTGITTADTGTYQVIVTSWFGCKDTARTYVSLVPIPNPPTVNAHTPYCQSETFIPFTVTGIASGAIVYWYPGASGGVGTTVPPTINTTIPGTYKFYFGQTIGSCESAIDSVTVVVNPTPLPITGVMGLCQYFTTNLSDPSAGGVWTSSNPSIASIGSSSGIVTGHLPGTVTVNYTLPTSCRTTAVITVHPKPAPPIIPEVRVCQFKTAPALSVTVGGPGYTTTWYGQGVTPPMPFAGNTSSIVPNTDVVGTYYYFVTQTSTFGCVSDSATFPVNVIDEPNAPMVVDTTYCQLEIPVPLTAYGDSLKWYTTALSTAFNRTAPIPPTINAGVTNWYVTQEVMGCESPRAAVTVTILVLPDFKITAERTWVCQFDSLELQYDGPNYIDPGYVWQLPIGSAFVNNTNANNRDVMIRFDTTWGKHFVILEVSNYKGRCSTKDTIEIRVIPAPNAHGYIKPNVCMGDTITLALSSHSSNAHTYNWWIDNQPIRTATGIDIVTSNINTGGPYRISFNSVGYHVITVTGFTEEGCAADPRGDTVKVHSLPDPRFDVSQIPTPKFCVEDSVLFSARVKNYDNNYRWQPEHFFVNQNKPEAWGRVELNNSRVALTVTSPFGCNATYATTLKPDDCCTVTMPNAFTPNGDGMNDRFRPIFDGYKRFHMFRVTNRWGHTVFESANSNPSWDGTYQGVMQDLGTYFYYLKYDCGGKTLETKGDITLVR